MSKDYRIGRASYCGDCTHSGSQHVRASCFVRGPLMERSGYCKGRPNYNDACDCTRTKESVALGAAAGPALDRKEVEEKRGTWKDVR